MNYPFINPPNPSFFDKISDPMAWLVGILVIILIYFALREFRCWYLKTNKIITMLEKINAKLDFLHVQNENQKVDTDEDRTFPPVAP